MLILLLLGFLLAWLLADFVYRRYWDRGLEILVQFADDSVYEGDSTILREEISNNKYLPMPAVEICMAMSRNLEFSSPEKENSNITDQNYKRDVFSFLGHQKVIRRIPVSCPKRGFYQITKVQVLAYDLSYSSHFYRELDQHTQMYVYPRRVDVQRISLICQAISGMVLVQNRLYPDPFEFSGIREYQRADPMNRINWKASAKNGNLMVNQQDSTTSITVTLILDVEDSGILKYESLTEESIRIVASLAARLVGAGMELDVIGNAAAGQLNVNGNAAAEQPNVNGNAAAMKPEADSNAAAGQPEGTSSAQHLAIHIKSGAGRMQELNRMLACIDTKIPADDIRGILEDEIHKKVTGHIYVLVSKNVYPETGSLLERLSAGNNQILWVAPVHRNMMAEEFRKPGVQRMRWEVE